MTPRRGVLGVALLATLTSVGAWAVTGGETLTKRVRIRIVERAADPEDFMDIARADDNGMVRETLRENGRWFGLIPGGYPRPGAWAPDFEWLSILSVSVPAWFLAGAVCLLPRRRRTPSQPVQSDST